jgi:hypothetical protein
MSRWSTAPMATPAPSVTSNWPLLPAREECASGSTSPVRHGQRTHAQCNTNAADNENARPLHCCIDCRVHQPCSSVMLPSEVSHVPRTCRVEARLASDCQSPSSWCAEVWRCPRTTIVFSQHRADPPTTHIRKAFYGDPILVALITSRLRARMTSSANRAAASTPAALYPAATQ